MIYNSDYIIYIIMHNYNDNYQSDIFPMVHAWPPNDLPSLRATQHCLHPSHPASPWGTHWDETMLWYHIAVISINGGCSKPK